MDRSFALVLGVCAAVGVGGAVLLTRRTAAETTARVRRLQRARDDAMRTGFDALWGYWVWAQVVERGVPVLTVSSDDMRLRPGPYGWPGCPRGIVCTASGIRTLAVDRRGTFHWVTNVRTSSDFEFHGRVRWERPGLARVILTHQYSCAHPHVNAPLAATHALRFRREGTRLHVAITDAETHFPIPEADPGAAPRWMVFHRVTREAYEQRFLVRMCQPEPDVDCDPACARRTIEPE